MTTIKHYIMTSFFISIFRLIGGSSNNTVVEGVRGWTVFARFRNDATIRIYVICGDCPHMHEGLKIDIIFNEKIYNAYYNPNHKGMSTEKGNDFISLYHRYKTLKDDNAFLTDFSVIFWKKVEIPSKTIKRIYVNEELLFGNSTSIDQFHDYEYSIGKSPTEQKSCLSLVTKMNHNAIVPEANISIQFSSPKVRGMILNFIFVEDLSGIKSPDFRVLKGPHKQWVLKDYGYYLEAESPVDVNLTLKSENGIRYPIPVSISLRNKVICGNYTLSDLQKLNPKLPKPTHVNDIPITSTYEKLGENLNSNTTIVKIIYLTDTSRIRIMLIFIIILILIYGIYFIVVTHLLKRWRNHYNEMMIYIRNVSRRNNTYLKSSRNHNSFSNFVIEDYSTFPEYELPDAASANTM